MATSREFMDFVHERIGLGARVTSRRMFGEYAVYLDGKVLLFVCDNCVFLKPTTAAEPLVHHLPQGAPYPGAKAYRILDELLEDPVRLQEVLQVTADALPMPKPRTAKKKSK
ncbi:TfoX/Sxy family protein [Gemmatimonas aurantiaca]|uniref:TfoX/Sxy family protein n=1 Tax=Gemmatimonas aurantiaca TaxID=173480 RepID=UPI00301E46F3